MAYQAKRSKKVIEEFELVNENNQVVEKLHVELDAGTMIQKIRQKYVALVRAQQSVQKIQAGVNVEEEISNAYTVLGTTVCDLIEAVFGKEDAEKIFKFYEDNYVELVTEVLPFITQIVIPKINEVAKQNKKEILSRYDRKKKKQRLGKGLM